MQVLRKGSRHFQVKLLQSLLNKKKKQDGLGAPFLNPDGDFGGLTDSALYAFQKRHHLVADKIAGFNTWQASGLRIEMEHSWVQLIGQTTDMSCWSAAASMILGNMTVGPGSGSLSPTGGLITNAASLQAFAEGLGWKALNYSPDVGELVDIVTRTPVWIVAAGPSFGHAVVLSGVYSDGTRTGDGVLFRIHDPWPVGVGSVYGSLANPLKIQGTLPASYFYVLVPE